MRIVFKLKGYVESGEITVIGRENIPVARCILVANHVDIGDTDIISEIVRLRQGRFLIDLREVPPAKPEGVIMAMAGAIPVDQSSKRAKLEVMETAARALVEDGENALLMIFPQGQLDPFEEIKLETFKRGTSEIAARAANRLDSSDALWIVPVGIHYKSDARMVPFPQKVLKCVFNSLIPRKRDGSPFFSISKYGAIAVIGEAIPVIAPQQGQKLPKENALATELIHSAIKASHDEAVDLGRLNELRPQSHERERRITLD